MDGHGSLTIRTRGDGENKVAGLAVQVIDTGCGMPPEVLERVFDPFYTTKPAGQGTGLGMSQVFAFCRQSGGEVQIASTEGEGTSVSMLLPRSEQHTSELQSLMRISYAVLCLKKKRQV